MWRSQSADGENLKGKHRQRRYGLPAELRQTTSEEIWCCSRKDSENAITDEDGGPGCNSDREVKQQTC